MADGPARPRSRAHRVAASLVEGGWLATVALIPLAVNPWGFNYELPKAALFRALTLSMAAAHLVAAAWSPVSPHPRRWLRRPLVRPILLLAGTTILVTLTSISPLVSLWGSHDRQQGTYSLLSLVLWTLLVTTHLRTSAQRRRLAAAIIVTASLVATTPFVEALRWHEDPLTWRPGGSLGNPIFLGAYLIMAIPFAAARLVKVLRTRTEPGEPASAEEDLQTSGATRSPRLRSTPARVAGLALALALQLAALLVTQSRGPWVGGLVGLALFIALLLWPTHRRVVLAGLAAGLILIGGLLAGLNFGLAPAERLSQLPYVGRLVLPEGLGGGTVRVRVVLWRAAGQVVTAWPAVGLQPDRLQSMRPLVGYGPDTAAIVYTAAYPPELAHIEDPSSIWDRAHNETLDVLTMQGWLGLLAGLVLGAAGARRGLALWRAGGSPARRAQVAAPLAALAAHVAEVQFAFSVTATAMMAWLCLAWLAADRGEDGPLPITSARQDPRSRGRWRVYAAAGAALLLLVAVRLEGGLLWSDVLVARARQHDRAGRWAESVQVYDRALDLIPWQATTHQFRAEAFYNLARALPEGQTALRTDLLEAADRGLARARSLAPLDVELISNAALLHAYWSETVDAAHLTTAVAFFRQAFRLAPTRAELRTGLGYLYHNHGLYQQALEQYRTALEIDPQHLAAHYSSGLAWLALDRPDRARQAFAAALVLAPDCAICLDAMQALEE